MNTFTIPIDLQQFVKVEQTYHYRIIPIKKNGNEIVKKTDSNIFILQSELNVLLDFAVSLEKETPENINRFLSTNYRKSNSETVFSLNCSSDFLEKILINAKEIGNSDIHFEPYENNSRVRFRLDRKLKEQFHINKEEYPFIVNKIKIRAQLDISEKRLP